MTKRVALPRGPSYPRKVGPGDRLIRTIKSKPGARLKIGTAACRVEVYLARDRDYWWRLVAQSNGRFKADSAEGYRRRGACIHEARTSFNGTGFPIVLIRPEDGVRQVLRDLPRGGEL